MNQQITKTTYLLIGCGDELCESTFTIDWSESFFLGIRDLHIVGEFVGILSRFLHKIKVMDLVIDIVQIGISNMPKNSSSFASSSFTFGGDAEKLQSLISALL
jgi:hypothetical protein